MSVLARRSLLVLALLFGLLFAVGSAVLWYYRISVWFALPFPVLIVGLQYLLGPYIIEWIFKISWMQPGDVSADLARFLEESCRRDGIPIPRFGIIEDGNPNAFTFGHTPSDARLVVTRGLVDMLSGDELEAVAGHELGHIKHWDFVVMTIAALVPLILYTIYCFTRYGSRGRGKGAGAAFLIAIVSYAAYILSQYIALFLSRVREYYADYHSARITQNPNALATALVTIAYGLAKAPPSEAEPSDDKKGMPAFNRMSAISSLSFFSPKGASQFAMAASDISGNFSAENMRKAMRWDLCNPWARWFELHSTHPLPARRIRDIERLARYADQTAAYQLEAAAPSYWGKFIEDLGVVLLPIMGALLGLLMPLIAWVQIGGQIHRMGIASGLVLLGLGLGMFLRTLLVYCGNFLPSTVADLVAQTDVSHIRPIPAVLKGKIIGRGMPGLRWSEDLVIQDETGFITLDYRQPLGFMEFIFGWLRASNFIGREAVVRGWFRRGPGPYLEMSQATFDDGETVNCYYYQFQLAVSAILAVMGLALTILIGQF